MTKRLHALPSPAGSLVAASWVHGFLFLAMVGPFAADAAAHPFHTSVAELEWNAKANSLEVSLRVDSLDLERALRRQAKRPIDLDKSPGISRLMRQYLQSTFLATGTDGKPLAMKWVGSEVTLKETWLYFEFPLGEQTGPVTLINAVLFDLEPDQANTVNFRSKSARTSFILTRDRPEFRLSASSRSRNDS